MSTKHTPGPWKVLDFHGLFVITDGGLTVADVTYQLPDAEGETARMANARLIAAAPELLSAAMNYAMRYAQDEAADDACEWVGCSQQQHEDAKALFAAIAKATGEQR